MTDFSARVEREPPSRELDAEITVALGRDVDWHIDYDANCNRYPVTRGEGGVWDEVPPYTSSLDAALTLVPDGAGIELHRYWLMSVDDPVWSALLRIGNGDATSAEDAPSAASALCAAALRALEAARRGDG